MVPDAVNDPMLAATKSLATLLAFDDAPAPSVPKLALSVFGDTGANVLERSYLMAMWLYIKLLLAVVVSVTVGVAEVAVELPDAGNVDVVSTP